MDVGLFYSVTIADIFRIFFLNNCLKCSPYSKALIRKKKMAGINDPTSPPN